MSARSKVALTLLALMLVPASSSACGRQQPPASLVGSTSFAPADRESPPAISGTTTDGKQLDLGDLRGKVVVLNSWASWCAPCRDEIPGFVALAQNTDPASVAVIGLNVNDNAKAAAAFEKELGMDYPSFVDLNGRILSSIPDIPPAAIPSTVVLDRQGRIAARIIGEADPNALANTVASLVAEPVQDSPTP